MDEWDERHSKIPRGLETYIRIRHSKEDVHEQGNYHRESVNDVPLLGAHRLFELVGAQNYDHSNKA